MSAIDQLDDPPLSYVYEKMAEHVEISQLS
jgi:hypothetical protein